MSDLTVACLVASLMPLLDENECSGCFFFSNNVAISEPTLNHLPFPFSVPGFDTGEGAAFRQGRQDDQDGSDPPSDPPTALEAVDESATPSGSGGVTVRTNLFFYPSPQVHRAIAILLNILESNTYGYVQRWPMRWALGCVNPPVSPRPAGTSSRNLGPTSCPAL